jgi:hypothetical protein
MVIRKVELFEAYFLKGNPAVASKVDSLRCISIAFLTVEVPLNKLST